MIVLMTDLVYPFDIMISLYLRLQLINNNLLLLLTLNNFLFSFNRDIIDIDISSLLVLSSLLSFTFNLLFLLCQLNLIHKFLLIYLNLWIEVDDLNIRIIVLLIKYLSLVLFQSLLRMLILLMQSSKTAVELFLSIFKLGIIYLFIDYLIRRKLFVFI